VPGAGPAGLTVTVTVLALPLVPRAAFNQFPPDWVWAEAE